MNKKSIFNDKVVWITGASSGIGEALVHEFAGLGARVIASSNDPEGLERVKLACGRPDAVSCESFDLADTSEIDKIVENQISAFGQIDYLLNIGGISQRSRIEETPLWLDRKIFEINYFGTVALAKAVLPYMLSRKSG
ncbi:MAG TPA: short-chain dehydrogenase, partial [Bacteroidales bacterium]|nr:short-chain dehydrogenase [Bacteroidales bacterium]